LPVVAAITPRSACSALSAVIDAVPLRTLKLPVGKWFSCFTNTEMP
jgi:hypothetical protein